MSFLKLFIEAPLQYFVTRIVSKTLIIKRQKQLQNFEPISCRPLVVILLRFLWMLLNTGCTRLGKFPIFRHKLFEKFYPLFISFHQKLSTSFRVSSSKLKQENKSKITFDFFSGISKTGLTNNVRNVKVLFFRD